MRYILRLKDRWFNPLRRFLGWRNWPVKFYILPDEIKAIEFTSKYRSILQSLDHRLIEREYVCPGNNTIITFSYTNPFDKSIPFALYQLEGKITYLKIGDDVIFDYR